MFVNVIVEARGMHNYKITVELLVKQKRLRAVLRPIHTHSIPCPCRSPAMPCR